MHKNKLIHGDLKGKNILVDRLMHIKICDFGLSKYVTFQTSESQRGAGSTPWKAPELVRLVADPKALLGESRTYKTDVYAFGMTIAEVGIPSCYLENRSPQTFVNPVLERTAAVQSLRQRARA